MPATDQDVRDFVAMLERLVFQLADQKHPALSPEQVRTRIAHKIAEAGLIDRHKRLPPRRPWETQTGPPADEPHA